MGSFRGCDNCRRWKKKCDAAQPKCSLCAKKNLPCVGVGRQRFKFKDLSTSRANGNSHEVPVRFNVTRSPSNDTSKLSSSIVCLFETRHPGYNISAVIRKSTVRYIGHSQMLDVSLSALVAIVESLQSLETSPLPICQSSTAPLQKYTLALGAVRNGLSNPTTRYRMDTLLAAFILSFCHMWTSQSGDKSTGHMGGLTHLTSTAAKQEHQDENGFFDDCRKLAAIQLLRASVFNREIQIYPWILEVFGINSQPRGLASPAYRIPTCTTSLWPYDFYCLDLSVYLMVPRLLQHPRQNIKSIQLIYREILRVYPTCTKDVRVGRDQPRDRDIQYDIMMQAISDEAQSLHIAIGITFNAFLRASDLANANDRLLAGERAIFCADAVRLAEKSKSQLPLSAHHIPLSTIAAWCIVADADTENKLRQLLEDYRTSYAMIHVLHFAPYWREAPEKLSREIPWFPRYQGSRPVESLGMDGSTHEIDTKMYEYCCIL